MKSATKLRSYLKPIDYWSIVLLLLASGSAYFFLYNAGITLLSLFFISILHYKLRAGNIQNNLFITSYSCLLIISLIIYGYSFALLGDILSFIATTLITLSFTFHDFRRGLLKVIVVMAIISIILEILFILGAFTPYLYGAGKNGLLGHYLYAFHSFGGGHLSTMHNHLCGIFWEPGIYQIALNLCLLYNLDILDKNSNISHRKVKFSILVVAIIMTMSTTGYLCLGLVLLGHYFQKAKVSISNKILALFALFAFVVLITSSSVITEKFSVDNRSFIVRANDFIGLCNAIWIRPMIGLGVYTKTFEQIAANFGMTNSLSAGLLLQTAQFGILWLISFYFCCIKEFKKRYIKIPVYIYMIIITALGLTEPLAFTPIMLINVLPFKNY